MGMVLNRVPRWLKKQKVKILFFIWPLSPKANKLMNAIGSGKVRDLRQISLKDLPALIELIDRKLITIS